MTTMTTHVLDVYHGTPASGVTITVSKLINGVFNVVKTVVTNDNGRCDEALFTDAASGTYELLFHIGDYYKVRGVALPEPAFLHEIPVRFSVAEQEGHYHIPLIVSPWNYQVYRGS